MPESAPSRAGSCRRHRSSGTRAAAGRRAGPRPPAARSGSVVVRSDGSRAASADIGPMDRRSTGLSWNWGGTSPSSRASRSEFRSTASGGGTPGIGSACSGPGSGWWNDADRVKIVSPCWTADTRRVVKDRPSRTRSTRYTIGTAGSPGRMKYACSECTGRSAGTVRPAATSACPATWPPNTRCTRASGLRPRKMFASICSRSSRSSSRSSGLAIKPQFVTGRAGCHRGNATASAPRRGSGLPGPGPATRTGTGAHAPWSPPHTVAAFPPRPPPASGRARWA